MADKKISALTAATLPLAGTEVLPIVQSSSTVKVATDDLTVKNIRSNATSGLLQVAGPGAATTRVMTVPDANFTAARTDAANSFTSDQTLSTGNLVQGTAAKGFNFTANTPKAGMTSQLLNWYEEGTFTPTIKGSSSAGTGTYSVQTGSYTRIGRVVYVQIALTWSAHTGTGNMQLAGLPFTAASSASGYGWLNPGYTNNLALTAGSYFIGAEVVDGNTVATFYQYPTGGGSVATIPIDTAAGLEITGTYFV